MTGPWRLVPGPAGDLRLYTTGSANGDSGNPRRTLLLCHELPRTRNGAGDAGKAYPLLADRIAAESGFRVAIATLRGAGGSTGDFSPAGWLEDLRFVAEHEAGPSGDLWMVGFGFGGALALRLASEQRRVRGVATLAGPADLSLWENDPGPMLARCRRSGAIHTEGFPADEAAWGAELAALRPVEAAADMRGRPLLVVHGSDDGEVPPSDAQALAEAASPGPVDLRFVLGAGHWLRADPRVVATLIGWLERQQ